jgi:DNA-binding GntR family transcriptional regulator
MAPRIDKGRFEPAYAQLAAILRGQIAEGLYPPGERIPSESSISKEYGVAPMTVRQAIGVLTEQGILERIQGSGTFVKPLNLTESRFELDSLREIFEDVETTQVKILQLTLSRADSRTAEKLSLPVGARVILIRRLLLSNARPVMFHEGRVRCDPTRPVVEAELSIGPLSELFTGQSGGAAKKGELAMIPAILGEQEAYKLGYPAGSPAFRLEYTVYDFDDIPFGWGWFLAPPDVLTLKTRLGLWEVL